MVEKTHASKKTHDMRILVTKTIMNTNPKFDFYTKLFLVMRSELFLRAEAQSLVEMVKDHPEITLTEVTLENLEEWHEQYKMENSDQGIFIMETMTEHFFIDLASQMRNEPVRDLFTDWKKWAGIPNDLFIHIRKATDLGDGVATLTVVTDDIVKFRKYCEDPDEVTYAGEIHFSESEAAMDPV